MIAIMSDWFFRRLIDLADKQIDVKKRTTLFRSGAPVRFVYVVIQGQAQLIRVQSDGGELVLQRAKAGEILAVGGLFSSTYHCSGVAEEGSTLARIPRRRLDELQSKDPSWLRELGARLSRELQASRGRAEILAMKRVADRVDAWVGLSGGTLPERGQWADLAKEIGVTPEALYRELARRRAQ